MKHINYHFFQHCLIIAFIILINVTCSSCGSRRSFYISTIGLHVQIEKKPFNNTKMSFSMTDSFGNDYVKYKKDSDIIYLDVYFVPPKTICVSGATFVKQDIFQIIEFKAIQNYHKRTVPPDFWVPEYYTEYTDSTFLKCPSYHFQIYDNFSGFLLKDSNGIVIYETE